MVERLRLRLRLRVLACPASPACCCLIFRSWLSLSPYSRCVGSTSRSTISGIPVIDRLRSARRSRMFSKLRSRGDSSQIPRREAPDAGAAYLWRFGQTVCASISEAVLVGCLAPSLMIGCQGVDVASHRGFESSSRQHTSPGTEIAVINLRHSNHAAHKLLSLREGLKKDVTEFCRWLVGTRSKLRPFGMLLCWESRWAGHS